MKREVKITFKNCTDFRNRIAKLWQEQPPDVCYEFIFPDEETKRDFDDLVSRFSPSLSISNEDPDS